VVTVILAFPSETPVTYPLLLTLATLVSLEIQLMALFVAFEGETVAVSAEVLPIPNDKLVALNAIPVTGTVTVIAHADVLLPSTVVTVIMALPSAMAVTAPALLTLATLVLLELQLTAWFVALDGDIVAVSDDLFPAKRFKLVLLNDTPVTGIGLVTFTTQVSVLWLSAVVAVIVAEPSANAVTIPVLFIEAILVLLDVQLIV
jgi:hypothetical protein